MKKLTQEVFKDATPDVKSACVCKDGFGELWSVPAKNLQPSGGEFLSSGAPVTYSYPLGHGFDATDWENSAIERDFSLHTISLNDDEIQIIVKGIMLLSDFDHITNIPLAETKALAFRFLPFLEDE